MHRQIHTKYQRDHHKIISKNPIRSLEYKKQNGFDAKIEMFENHTVIS